MPSPFPGMNPYLEQASVWEDFHQAFATEIRESLAAQVRPSFFVKLEERVFIHEPSSEERLRLLGKPDVALFDASPRSGQAGTPPYPERCRNKRLQPPGAAQAQVRVLDRSAQ